MSETKWNVWLSGKVAAFHISRIVKAQACCSMLRSWLDKTFQWTIFFRRENILMNDDDIIL